MRELAPPAQTTPCVPRSPVFTIPARNVLFHFSILGEIKPISTVLFVCFFVFNEDTIF